jgi:hypothetical protein
MTHDDRHPPERTCHACNQPIRFLDDRCRGRFGDDGGIRHWHAACFVAIAVAKPER